MPDDGNEIAPPARLHLQPGIVGRPSSVAPAHRLPIDDVNAALVQLAKAEENAIGKRLVLLLRSNYPPAEPGALFSVSRSKRLEGDADASPAHCAT